VYRSTVLESVPEYTGVTPNSGDFYIADQDQIKEEFGKALVSTTITLEVLCVQRRFHCFGECILYYRISGRGFRNVFALGTFRRRVNIT
jgi:hypothetical protein